MLVAEKYGLYRHIRFNSEVKEARWDDAEMQWKVGVEVSGDKDSQYGRSYTITTDFVASAVGQLNVPQIPNIPGLNDFQGKTMHSARWDWTYDFKGKRIAVIGNGAFLGLGFMERIDLVLTACSRRDICSDSPGGGQSRISPHRLPENPELGRSSVRCTRVAYPAGFADVYPPVAYT